MMNHTEYLKRGENMKEKDKRYRRKLRQYNVTFYLHEQRESDYFAGLGISIKRYLMEKIKEDMEKDGYKNSFIKEKI